MTKLQKYSLTATQLKYVAVIAMLLDHIAWAFLPIHTPLAQIMHIIGRITAPVMAYMVAEGYRHTKNLRQYLLRMFLFSLISWVPFSLFNKGVWPTSCFSVISSLFAGLLMICIWEEKKLPQFLREALLVILALATITCDWGITLPFMVFVFHRYRDEPKEKWLYYYAIVIAQAATYLYSDAAANYYIIGMLFVPLLLMQYNGERGSGGAFSKWFFYIFYPLHIYILYLLKY